MRVSDWDSVHRARVRIPLYFEIFARGLISNFSRKILIGRSLLNQDQLRSFLRARTDQKNLRSSSARDRAKLCGGLRHRLTALFALIAGSAFVELHSCASTLSDCNGQRMLIGLMCGLDVMQSTTSSGAPANGLPGWLPLPFNGQFDGLKIRSVKGPASFVLRKRTREAPTGIPVQFSLQNGYSCPVPDFTCCS